MRGGIDMSGIAIPQETVERILRQQLAIMVFRELKTHLAYVKCVQETGGDWENPDCLRIVYGSPEPPPPGEELPVPMPPSSLRVLQGTALPVLEELLAQMPEDEQQQVATSILEAQARLMEQYIPEIEEWIHGL
jgi:hypothetical protein